MEMSLSPVFAARQQTTALLGEDEILQHRRGRKFWVQEDAADSRHGMLAYSM